MAPGSLSTSKSSNWRSSTAGVSQITGRKRGRVGLRNYPKAFLMVFDAAYVKYPAFLPRTRVHHGQHARRVARPCAILAAAVENGIQ